MDFRVGDDQRKLAEGIRSLVAGRLPLQHVRAREGAERVADAADWSALGDLAMEVLDRAALSFDPQLGPDGDGLGNEELLRAWFKSISLTIAAGTSQVQRNIVAERILGLPKGR